METGYDTSFRCTYKDKATAVQDDAYQADFLRAFRLKEWDGAAVTQTLDRVFSRLRDMPGLRSLIGTAKCEHSGALHLAGGDDDRSVMQLLFSFDLFDKAHAGICDMLEKGQARGHGHGAEAAENI